MNRSQHALLALGAVTAIGIFTIQSESPLQAFAPPPDRDVFVVNGLANPVPVTGQIAVSGTSTVAGTVAATQAGAWSVGINPAQNTVKLAPGQTFFHDSSFGAFNDGDEVILGPFDTSGLKQLRIMAHAINGDVHYELRSQFTTGPVMRLDTFTAAGEDGPATVNRVYDAPPPNVSIRMTESGPGGTNYQFVLIGN